MRQGARSRVKSRKSFDGQVYEYWTLCQTVRTERGPRQQVVTCRGKLSEEDLQAGWADSEALLDGRAPSPGRISPLPPRARGVNPWRGGRRGIWGV